MIGEGVGKTQHLVKAYNYNIRHEFGDIQNSKEMVAEHETREKPCLLDDLLGDLINGFY